MGFAKIDMETIEEFKEIIGNLSSNNAKTDILEVDKFKRDKATLITCKEAAKLYPIGEAKFRQLCHSKGKNFPYLKIGCRIYIVKEKLDKWFIENANGIEL